jgi:autotransporter-associated beta strand protein
MKRRKKLIGLRIGGLKCLIAIVLSLAFISHAHAAVDVLDLWNFNNSAGADGSFPGVFYTSPNPYPDGEYYDDSSKSIINASSGVFATSSKVDVSTLGVMGYNSGTTPAGWGTFAGTTGGTDHALAVETYNYVNGTVYSGVTYTGPNTLVTNNGNYVEFDLATTGYKNIKLTYDYRATSTSFTTQDWQYSVDGGATWTNFSTLSTTRTSSWFTGNTVNFYSANSDLTNKSDVRVRVYLSGATTATNPANTRFDNVKFSGLSLSSAVLTWNPPSNTWNTSNTNWLNGSTSTIYNDGDVVEFTDAGLASGSTINVTSGLNPGEIHVTNTTGVYTFSGASLNGSFDLIKTGAGAVKFGVDNTSYSGNISINEGTMQVGADINPTAGILYLNGGTIQRTSTGDVTFSKNINFSGPSKVDTNGGNLELSGYLTSGYSLTALTKIGSGTLTLSAPDSNPPGFFHGNVDVQAGTLRLNATNSLGYTAIGDGSVKVEQGATFQVDNITYGIPSSGYLDLYKGSTLLGSGAAGLQYGNVAVVANSSANPSNIVDLKTNSADDVLTLASAVQQYSTDYSKPTNATIRVSGPGRVVLQSGGISSQYTYGGDWELDSGVLQIGPVEPNYTPVPDPGYNGPHGEPLNALGFKVPATQLHGGNDADPDLPNAITVKGGILAIAVDAHNTNPANTAFPVNSTPDYIRNPVILAGGKIAATGYEVTYNTDPGLGEGIPNSNPVVARFGGDFTVAAGISQVLTYDPVGGTGARTVELVGGQRHIDNDSAGFNAGQTITYSTDWVGTLQVDPGSTTGGSFNINRTGGNVSVTPGAELDILANATVNLSGANALSDGTNSVNIVNNGDFDVLNGNHQVGDITGNGSVTVEGDATLTAQSITADTLTIGSGTTLTILPISGCTSAGDTSLITVPEPSTLLLLSLAGLVGLFRMYYRIKR